MALLRKIEHAHVLLCRFWACLPSDPLLIVPDVLGFFRWVMATPLRQPCQLASSSSNEKQWRENGKQKKEGRSQGISLPAPSSTLTPSPMSGSFPCDSCSFHMGPAATGEAGRDSSFWICLTLVLGSGNTNTLFLHPNFLLLLIFGLPYHLLLGFPATGYHTPQQ